MEQLRLELFRRPKQDPWEGFLSWGEESPNWGPECEWLARQVRDECPRDWWDRCKAIVSHCGYGGREPSELAAAGILDPQMGYHVVWDRSWAIRHGVAVSVADKVAYWDYSRKLPACHAARMRV